MQVELIDFANTIACISPFLVAGCIITWLMIGNLSWREILAIKRSHEEKRYLFDLLILYFFFSIPLCYLSAITLYNINNAIHFYNLWGIIIVIAILTLIRLGIEYSEIKGEGRSPWVKSAFDFTKKSILVLSSYPATLTSIKMYRYSSLIISIFLIVIVVKYRIYDDIVKYELYSSESKRYISKSNHPGHTILRGLLDHIPRAYIYSSYAFSNIGLLLVGPDISNGNLDHINDCAFNISNNCSNIFIDFFYFNIVTIATVGYGDISPKSALAKIICSFEIVFGVVVLATVLSLMVGRVQNLAAQKAKEK